MTNTDASAETLPTPADNEQDRPAASIAPDDARVAAAVHGYVTALLWSSAYVVDQGGYESADNAADDYELSDFSADDQASIVADVYAMIAGQPESVRDFLAYLDRRSGLGTVEEVAEHFGHDFALTRNGHGAGFWDRGLGDLGDRLTAMSKPYGESSVNVSEEGVSLE